MSEPFSYYEDGGFDVEPEEVVFKWGAVLFSHEEADESFVSFVEFFGLDSETDSCGVNYA